MAKEQWHNWGRYILLAIVIIFASGGWAMKVMSNTEAISEVKEDVELAEDDIVILRLQYKDITGLTSSINESLRDLKVGQAASNTVQQKMVTDVAVISEKVKTLTKE